MAGSNEGGDEVQLDAQAVITRLSAELASAIQRAVIAESMVEELRKPAEAKGGE
jgi:hypothetical protein